MDEATYASIANRDTDGDQHRGVEDERRQRMALPPPTRRSGIDVGWSLFVGRQPRRSVTNTSDSTRIAMASSITSTWSHSYPILRATNRLVGALSTRGFDYRMVQADVLSWP